MKMIARSFVVAGFFAATTTLVAPAFANGFGAAAQEPLRTRSVSVSGPRTVATLDLGRLKGDPARLAWSPDETQFYLQTREGTAGQPNAKLHHYLFDASNGSKRDVDAEPEWASAYWTAKSAQASPDDPTLKIELKTERRQQRTTSVTMGGDLARGATTTGDTGTSAGDALAAAYQSQTATAHVMQLKGITIGEFVNSVIVPGLTFGWGPKGTKAIAFTELKSGRLVLMDAEGGRREIEASKDAILPAWSRDGSSVAWLQQDGRRKFVLQVARVSAS